jgi:hypothetical protein
MEVDEKAIWIARRLLGFIALRELLLVPQSPNSHLWRLSLSGDTLHH